VCAALGRCCGTKCPLYLVLFFFLLLSSVPHTFLPEGVILGLQNFAQSFKSQKKIRFGVNKNWYLHKLSTNNHLIKFLTFTFLPISNSYIKENPLSSHRDSLSQSHTISHHIILCHTVAYHLIPFHTILNLCIQYILTS
jgi:hypothetical protein